MYIGITISQLKIIFFCILQNGTGDANDVWIMEVVGGSTTTYVQTVRSQIRLIHYHVRCALQSHDKKLPKWYVPEWTVSNIRK